MWKRQRLTTIRSRLQGVFESPVHTDYTEQVNRWLGKESITVRGDGVCRSDPVRRAAWITAAGRPLATGFVVMEFWPGLVIERYEMAISSPRTELAKATPCHPDPR